MNCLFCKIISGEIPATKVYEDEKTFAFLDINPVNQGHTLVVPKKHSTNIFDIGKEDLCAVAETSQKIAKAIKESIKPDGVNVISNNERAAGQVIMHSHTHIVPRFTDDGFRNWPGTPYKNDEEAEEVANKIKDRMKII